MPRKILAIDDSQTLRQFIARSLAKHSADYLVLTAKDGGEGLAMAKAEKPELILLDFVLPDMKGDEVCRRLLLDPETAGLPIVLMSSSASEIRRTEGEFTTVKKALAKPFSPELLCATVAHVLREVSGIAAPAPAATPAPAPVPVAATASATAAPAVISFMGNTAYFSLSRALIAVGEDRLTGVLRIHTGEQPIEVYCTAGQVRVVTTRDSQTYLKNNPHAFSLEQIALLNGATQTQDKTGCPVFLSLAEQGALSFAQSVTLCQTFGLRVFGQAWTGGRSKFEFQVLTELPDFARALPAFEGTMDEFAMETLRCVGQDFLSAMAWGEPTGIPAYTRDGYDRIQHVPLTDEEWQFATLVATNIPLIDIAGQMRLSTDQAQQLLYRFLCLEIFDYWPATALRRE